MHLNRTKAVEIIIQLPQSKTDHIVKLLPVVFRHGNVGLATTLLEKCQFWWPTDDSEPVRLALRVAVKKGNAALVDVILPILDILPEEFDEAGLGPHLFTAIKKGYWGIAEALLWAGNEIPSVNLGVLTDFISILGADVNDPVSACEERWGSFTLLNRAVLGNHKEAVKWLIEKGAHLGDDQAGGTPLNNAVAENNLSMVILLLGLNADPNLVGSYVRIDLQSLLVV